MVAAPPGAGCRAVSAFLLLAFAQATLAFQPDEAAGLLQKADRIKTAELAEFTALLDSLAAQSKDLTASQQEMLRYLQAWKIVYDGQYSWCCYPRSPTRPRANRD